MKPTLRGLFLRQRRLDSLALRTFMWSSWSHVAVVNPHTGSDVIDATFFHGVALRRIDAVLGRASQYAFKDVECPDPVAAWDWCTSQIGKPYDVSGVLGIALHRDWQKEDAFFCSELFELALKAGGRQRFIGKVHRVTPEHSWMVI